MFKRLFKPNPFVQFTPYRCFKSVHSSFGVLTSASLLSFSLERMCSRNDNSVQCAPLPNKNFSTENRFESVRKIGKNAFEGAEISLFQYKICPFCNKVKAVMDYLGVQYRTVEVNPLTKKEIKFSKDYQKVPVVLIGQDCLKDSHSIINSMVERIKMENLSKSDIFDDFVSENAIKWAKFADDKLAILLYPNITRSFGESLQAFSYIKKVDSFNSFEKYSNLMIGSFAMWMAQGKIKKKYGIKDERESLQKAISLWTNEIKGRQFLGQNEPNLGDLCIFGCLRAIEGLDAFDDIMRDNVELDKWYKRVVKVLEYEPII
mmetsp:Transcript_4789/g.7245  ORF Transcript_4789/g.7245 Transcript_4789/m.7245 type:complete len:318 (+) Transcript_4789:41-994(+)